MELLELMEELFIQHATEAVKTPARHIKLWENLSIETLGPRHYHRWLVPLYRKLLDIFDKAGKRLLVHYDGKLSLIADEIAELDIDGHGFAHPAPRRRHEHRTGPQQVAQQIFFGCIRRWGWYRGKHKPTSTANI